MKLTQHQKRILAGLLELERRFAWSWWPRETIGRIVGAGGYHAVIQTRTMLALSSLGLVLLEVESWPAETRRLVRCNCASYDWGLTDAGRAIATSIPIRWPEKAEEQFKWVRVAHEDVHEGRTTRGDRFVRPNFLDLDDDDDPAEFWKRGE